MIEITIPGCHPDLTNEEYHKCKQLSRSQLVTFMESPAAFELKKSQPNVPTAAQEMGTALHTAVLEPDKFGDMVLCGPTDSRGVKWAKEQEQNPGKTLITHKEYIDVCGMAEAVLDGNIHNYWDPGNLLEDETGVAEQSFFWTDKESGIDLRCRPDFFYVDDLGAMRIVELKSCRPGKASFSEFSGEIARYNYHIQAAMYLDGASAVFSRKCEEWVFIVVESKPPYLTAVHTLGEESIEIGRYEYKKALIKYANYIAMGKNGSRMTYADSGRDIQLPGWRMKQHLEEINV